MIRKLECLKCSKRICLTNYLYGSKLCKSCYCKTLTEEKNHNFKNRKPKCIDCNKEIYWQRKRCKKCNLIFLKSKIGENNPNWKKGVSFIPYSSEFNKELKERIRQRDNYICQNCNKTQEQQLLEIRQPLSIHHIDYNKQNCKETNLITLCHKCNSIANRNREYWIIFYREKIWQKNQLKILVN